MREVEVARLLAFANGLDQRQGIDTVKVQAWFAQFQQEAPSMEYLWAERYAARHYSEPEKGMLTPGHLVKAWREHLRLKADREFVTENDAHCGHAYCACTHTGPCYKGWIDNDEGRTTAPCRVCRESLAKVLGEIAPLGYRSAHDQSRIRNREVERLTGERL